MKQFFFLFFLVPFFTMAQIEQAIKLKVAVIQNFVHKGENGETLFWQTKGKITYAIVNYTEQQNHQFKDLFIKQYREIKPIYDKMVVSDDERDTSLFIKTLIRHEEEFRKLLTPAQLIAYSKKLTEYEKSNPEAHKTYSSLFFSDNLLIEFKSRF